jgi:hypothetical protein
VALVQVKSNLRLGKGGNDVVGEDRVPSDLGAAREVPCQKWWRYMHEWRGNELA